jgi:hypothetical protein
VALVPVEGSWSGVTSVGLPVSFKVEGANVVDSRCPATHASFLAVPGEISPPAPLQYYTVMDAGSGHQRRPAVQAQVDADGQGHAKSADSRRAG